MVIVAQFRRLLIFRLFLLVIGKRFRDFRLGLVGVVLLLNLIGIKRDRSLTWGRIDTRWGRSLF